MGSRDGKQRTSVSRRDVRGWRQLATAALIAVVALGCGRQARPSEPYSVALVYCGWEMWIGNDQNPDLQASDPSRWPGALLALKEALDQADLAHRAQPGTRGVLISYDEGAKVRVAMGPIANFTAAALGTQRDYAGTISFDLVKGLTRGVDELEKAPAGHRLMIVVSDGVDTYREQAVALLPALKQRIAALGIEVSSIVYKSELSEKGDLMAEVTDHNTRAASRADITFDVVNELRRVQRPGASGQ